jgi:hypothetical protein
MSIRRPHAATTARAMGALALALAGSAGAVLLSAGAAHAAQPSLVRADRPVHSAALGHAQQSVAYAFTTLDNSNDLTFNQLLGINNSDVIAGYFGSGAANHPNKGYYLLPGGKQLQLGYRVENFPGSTQTQVTGLNDRGTQVGFLSPTDNGSGNDANYGWYSTDDGVTFHEITVPGVTLGSPAVTQLLGVDNREAAVGFYNDSAGNSHGFVYDIWDNHFAFTSIPSATSVTDSAINNHGDIAGFFTPSGSSTVESFLLHNHRMWTLAYSGASMTQALGLNDSDEVVGVVTIGSGSSAAMHGFTWTPQAGFTLVDDPNGMGTTTVNGVNNHGDLVGFYVDGAGNTDGMLATPKS